MESKEVLQQTLFIRRFLRKLGLRHRPASERSKPDEHSTVARPGDDNALAEFERAFAAEIKRAIRRLDSTGDLGDEVLQVMREKLFVGAGDERRGIERYCGRGPLGRWLWVMATREALMYRRRRRRETPLVEGHIQIAEGDLELDYLKREYRAAFRVAFAAALVSATRSRLADRLKVGDEELDSIMRLVGSRLEASVERVLQPG